MIIMMIMLYWKLEYNDEKIIIIMISFCTINNFSTMYAIVMPHAKCHMQQQQQQQQQQGLFEL